MCNAVGNPRPNSVCTLSKTRLAWLFPILVSLTALHEMAIGVQDKNSNRPAILSLHPLGPNTTLLVRSP